MHGIAKVERQIFVVDDVVHFLFGFGGRDLGLGLTRIQKKMTYGRKRGEFKEVGEIT